VSPKERCALGKPGCGAWSIAVRSQVFDRCVEPLESEIYRSLIFRPSCLQLRVAAHSASSRCSRASIDLWLINAYEAPTINKAWTAFILPCSPNHPADAGCHDCPSPLLAYSFTFPVQPTWVLQLLAARWTLPQSIGLGWARVGQLPFLDTLQLVVCYCSVPRCIISTGGARIAPRQALKNAA